jgi:hypothetical protein
MDTSIPTKSTPDSAWIRIPQARALTSLSRSKIYLLLKEGKIRSASLKDPGQRHATRLIDRADLLRYIESCVDVQP